MRLRDIFTDDKNEINRLRSENALLKLLQNMHHRKMHIDENNTYTESELLIIERHNKNQNQPLDTENDELLYIISRLFSRVGETDRYGKEYPENELISLQDIGRTMGDVFLFTKYASQENKRLEWEKQSLVDFLKNDLWKRVYGHPYNWFIKNDLLEMCRPKDERRAQQPLKRRTAEMPCEAMLASYTQPKEESVCVNIKRD